MHRVISFVVMVALLIACSPQPTPVPSQATAPSYEPVAPSYGPVNDQPETPIAVLTGIATWYDAERKGQSAWYTRAGVKFYAAAGPGLRKYTPNKWRMKPYHIIVKSVKTGRVVDVWIVDWCGCYGTSKSGDERLVDLAPAVWEALGVRLGLGIMKVEITVPKPKLDGTAPCPYAVGCP